MIIYGIVVTYNHHESFDIPQEFWIRYIQNLVKYCSGQELYILK